MRFFVGLHQPADSAHTARAFISINRVRGRQAPVPCAEWILDSGAFSELSKFGSYRHEPEVYADEVNRLSAINSGLFCAVSQDYMCEPWIVEKTGLSVIEHQQHTITRYDQLVPRTKIYVLPVLQGYTVPDYLQHLAMYEKRLRYGQWVGVGSVCKRNGTPAQVEAILTAIKIKRPDLKLHGFGLKITALKNQLIRDCLFSADSMAWSYHARKNTGRQNKWQEAVKFVRIIEALNQAPGTNLLTRQ